MAAQSCSDTSTALLRLPVITSEDRKRSEAFRGDEYPQVDSTGCYATGILLHVGPTIGYSIGCITMSAPQLQELAAMTPKAGWKVRLVDPQP